jgi:hypothetical protein
VYSLLLFALAVGASAKCPTGYVALKGTVNNVPSEVSGLELIATVVTPKGEPSRRVSLSTGEFTITVPFSTSSSSFMGGDRCHNMPTVIEVRISSSEKIYVQKRLLFKKYFETYGSYLFRLKRELPLDIKADSR